MQQENTLRVEANSTRTRLPQRSQVQLELCIASWRWEGLIRWPRLGPTQRAHVLPQEDRRSHCRRLLLPLLGGGAAYCCCRDRFLLLAAVQAMWANRTPRLTALAHPTRRLRHTSGDTRAAFQGKACAMDTLQQHTIHISA